MLPEDEVDSFHRYLLVTASLSERILGDLRHSVVEFMNGRQKDEVYQEYIDWIPAFNEVAVFSQYAYADLVLPRRLDCLFVVDEPNIVVFTPYVVPFSVMDGRAPLKEISHGHQHMLVLRFEESVPEVLQRLKSFEAGRSPSSGVKLGLCQSADWPGIREYLMR